MAYLLDTCVISELVRVEPDKAVVRWFDKSYGSGVLCSPVVMELEAGLAIDKKGAPSPKLRAAIDRLLRRFLAERRLVFDEAAAVASAAVLGVARRTGRPIGIVDAQIIGLAISTRSAVATRDADFLDRGVEIVNPWM
ncbi:MAG: PIN domain-containing protein [Parvularculaceae bacterium]